MRGILQRNLVSSWARIYRYKSTGQKPAEFTDFEFEVIDENDDQKPESSRNNYREVRNSKFEKFEIRQNVAEVIDKSEGDILKEISIVEKENESMEGLVWD